jgi:hypothetical protein
MQLGTKVKVIKNFGNECEPFVGLTGVVAPPARLGCRGQGWVGVMLDQLTIYGKHFNFQVEELEVLDKTDQNA